MAKKSHYVNRRLRRIPPRKLNRMMTLKRKLPYRIARTTFKKVVVPTAVTAVKAYNEAGNAIVRKGIKQAKDSTSFDNRYKSEESVASGYIGNASESYGKAVVGAPKKFKQSIKHTKQGIKRTKRSISGLKSSASDVRTGTKAVNKAFQQYRQSKFIKHMVSNKAAKAAKAANAKFAAAGSLKIFKGLGKAAYHLAQAARGLLTALIGAAGAVVPVLLIISAATMLFTSPFGIFFPDEENTITMREAIKQINVRYQERLNEIIDAYDDGSVDLIEYSGNRIQWKYVIAIYAVKYSNENGDVMTLNDKMVGNLEKIFFEFHDFDISFSWRDTEKDSRLKVMTVNTTTKTMAEMMDSYRFSESDREMVQDLLKQNTNEMWVDLLYDISGNGGYALVSVARDQIGTPGGQTYWSWYGYNAANAPSDWSGCFVSWCANEIGYIDQGVFPQFSNAQSGINWFKNNGMWQEATSAPSVGDIIFLDFNQDGIADRCGIVSGIVNDMVKYITGTKRSGDEVLEAAVTLDNKYGWTLGYGMLPQLSGLVGDTLEEQCFNYLRQDGYSALAACIVLANFQGECSCDPGTIQTDFGDAVGLMMWTGPNRTTYFSWCDSNAYDWRNLETQLYFYSYWLDDVCNGEWGRVSTYLHPDFQILHSTQEFKELSADKYGGDVARALYEGTAMFVDDMERPLDTIGAETRRYTYAVQFYHYFVDGSLDGTTQAAWQPVYENDIGVFHQY